MDIELAGLTAPHSELNYIALFGSATGKLYACSRSLPEGQDPEDFAKDVLNVYKQQTTQLKHIFYRTAIFKRPIVSTVKLSETRGSSLSFAGRHVDSQSSSRPLPQITNLVTSALAEGPLFIQEWVYDPTLTAAMKNATVLRNIDPDSFYANYDEIIVKAGGPAPQAAILIHLEDDRAASGVFRIVSSAISITMGLMGIFVF